VLLLDSAFADTTWVSLSNQVLLDSPVGYWPLDETSGTTAIDISGNGRNGTYSGSYTLNGVLGPLRGVDLTGGHVEIADHAAWSADTTGFLSVEAWIKLDTTANAMMFVTKGASSNYEWDLRSGDVTPTGLAVVHYTGAGVGVINVAVGAGVIGTTRAYHLAFTYDRTGQLLIAYVNGVEVGRDTTASGSTTAGTAAVRIGARADAAGAVTDGRIAHVAIYSTVLTPARIVAHYEAGIRNGVVHG
jgi:hypothetical protein